MNSALQVLYMNPLFRQIIYDLPLCVAEDITIPSEFVQIGAGYDILLEIQKLFIKLECFNIRAISTISLTETFNWSGSDGSAQHDSQEFIRLIFETLDGILSKTPFSGVINNLFTVVNDSKRICSNCALTNISSEFNLEITLPVRDKKGLFESLNSLYCETEIISDYKCDGCNQKVNLEKSTKISQLPILLNFSLNKMDFDYNTFERIKLNSRYEFPLEIYMKDYFSEDLEISLEDSIYELYSIIIHRGTPYQGHYFSYIRDLNLEGVWNLVNLNGFKEQPSKEANCEVKEEAPPKSKKKKKENLNEKECKIIIYLDEKINFDECDHPLKYINKDLANNWFDFNDTSITPIRVGRIQKQFQSSESAYILFYMKKNTVIKQPNAPLYLRKCIFLINFRY